LFTFVGPVPASRGLAEANPLLIRRIEVDSVAALSGWRGNTCTAKSSWAQIAL